MQTQTQTSNNTGTLSTIALDLIVPFALGNSRSKRNPHKFSELKNSIQQQGVIQPVLLRPSDVDGLYELIAGNGRHQAAVELGLAEIPSMIRKMDDREALEAHITENSNREDLGLVDEARVAGKWFAFFEGDKKAAAQRLGWTLKKLNERLELLRCAEPVLQAIDDGHIKPAHAMILASFTESRQTNTLQSIIAEKWSVEYLKQRAGKAQRYIATAKFDTTGCIGCPHNSEAQAGLFEADDRAKCSKMICFKEKTDAWLAVVQQEAEEQYGKVLRVVDVQNDCSSLDASVVGEDQFKSGCTGCKSNVTLIDDRPGREGSLYHNQCLDTACFVKCTKRMQEPEPVVTQQLTTGEPATDSKPVTKAAPKTAKAKKPVEQKTSRKIIDKSRIDLRQLAADHMLKDATFNRGLVLALICQRGGYKPKIDGVSGNFINLVTGAIGQDANLIQKEIFAAVEHLTRNTKDNDCQSDHQFIDLMLKSFSKNEQHRDLAVASWNPNNEILSNYTKEQLVRICEESGFTKAYNAAGHEGGFKALSSKGKKEFIDGILKSKFDWSGYAPEQGYLDQLK